ncbi:helix-turn-helix domain-containing protein [Tenacibaculum maritimum]|uniref:helix-turn-helix domain-containing protein n=1 Tax=Tenacibaculum maritimum TaxID=107401 RepID=UPI0012E6B609|nr:helix-turn-helix transcriptional regulator [Tenacibaculum maritimum]CAA0227438.1 Transcription factor [Tenacibaculum maritimum]CAA0248862.1 putative transcriptional regulator [Tenacibaculum maritimum]
MDFGSIVASIRKNKKISQTDLASQLGIHKNVLGRYERNEVFPSIEIARKIADILDVSLDYLTGRTETIIDKNTHNRILEVSNFEQQDREHIFSVIDAFIAKRKIQSIL